MLQLMSRNLRKIQLNTLIVKKEYIISNKFYISGLQLEFELKILQQH